MTDLLVLHTLRCLGFTDLARIADASGLPEPEAESRLIDLAVDGLVTRTAGPFGGWGLTEAGKAADARLVAAELTAAGARDAVVGAFEDFLVLNPELLDLCSAWHLRQVDGVATVNDHTDAAYDGRVLARFADLDRRAEAVCGALGAALPRFGRYRGRLAAALARAEAGELEHLADTTTSYHNVWFQLHEDLLVTLGIPR
ncbi:transcriptional regulator [Actinoplanes sp. NEAU-A12]|uniref:Transcriptional regulator n=1 Tax=Actinoplanes sandaracinus TaxID=3045177 RepID=A0ABT6WRJ3_9ACTN|nr:transcriptional regulator [Actinoplanes sandaracinus]MDI6102357.1 transcriptional regulator [Actinoplanes sandaracinus]